MRRDNFIVDFITTKTSNRRGYVDEHGMIPMGADDEFNESDAPPTVKMRNAAQQEVTRLLDALAPERAPNRRDPTNAGVERHRTPRGCIVQGATGAVTVSWFADSAQGSELGELQVVAWRGTVTRPGSSERSGGATLIEELVLRPVENRTGTIVWRTEDGTVFTTESLVAHSLAWFDQRMEGEGESEGEGEGERGGGGRISG